MTGRVLVPVEAIAEGDTIVLPRGARREVVRVERFDDGTFVVVYKTNLAWSHEYRAAERGARVTIREVERGLRPLRAGELVARAA